MFNLGVDGLEFVDLIDRRFWNGEKDPQKDEVKGGKVKKMLALVYRLLMETQTS
jgi:hypothetical protein